MQQIWTNPSVERSFIQLSVTDATLVDYMKLNVKNGNSSPKDISIFQGFEYFFSFYDANYGTIRSIKALVTDVYSDQIKVKYKPSKENDKIDCNICKKRDRCDAKRGRKVPQSPMPTCNCILNPPLNTNYDEPIVYFIPVANLIDVKYIGTQNDDDKNKREDVHVMLLGISATMVKAIILRLEFFDDAINDAVKYVEMKAGNIYDIAYEDKDGTVYESRAKVIRIEEDPHGCECCKPGKGYVRENVGGNNIIYTSCCHHKDDFMQEPPVPLVKIIVDTSEDFEGRYETILLHTIRDCTLVSDESGDVPDEPTIPDCCANCIYKTDDCEMSTCGHCIPPKPPKDCGCVDEPEYTYNYEKNTMKAVIKGEKVDLFVQGQKTEITLDSLVKFYLGLD